MVKDFVVPILFYYLVFNRNLGLAENNSQNTYTAHIMSLNIIWTGHDVCI